MYLLIILIFRRIIESYGGQVIAKSCRKDGSTEFVIGFQIPLEIVPKTVTIRSFHSCCLDENENQSNDLSVSIRSHVNEVIENDDSEPENTEIVAGDEKENERNVIKSFLQFSNSERSLVSKKIEASASIGSGRRENSFRFTQNNTIRCLVVDGKKNIP